MSILIMVAVLSGIVWIGENVDHALGVVLMIVFGAVVVGLGASVMRDERRAHTNFVRYWADGGPDGRRRSGRR